MFKGIEDVVAGFLELGKTIDLCTNALRLEEFLDVFEPDYRLTFVVHLDGMREIHDYICDYPGLWDVAVDAIRRAREAGFRVTTNTTIFKETAVEDVIEMMAFLTNDVGIDGMLIAPGYQYSQIDPALTMTRAEHEEKFRAVRAAVREHGYRWLASPIYQDFLTGERELPCAPWGSITRNPYGWKGPCYLLTDGIFPSYEALLEGIEWEHYGPGQRPALRALRHPLRLRAVGGVRGDEQRQGNGAEHGVDADGLTMACATTAEQRAARKAGLRTALVGLGAKNGIPQERVVSFGLAGGLGDLPCGHRDRRDARRRRGRTRALGGRPARRAGRTPGNAARDGPSDRRPGRAPSGRTRRTGADAVDLESGVLAASGRLAGCLRAVSDTPERTLHGLCNAVHDDGRYAWGGLVKAFARAPIGVSRAGVDGKRALDELSQAGKRWAA